MKNFAKTFIFGAVAVACAVSLSACTSNDNNSGGGNTIVTESLAEQQVNRAKSTYESFYKKKGGLFSAQPSDTTSAVKTSTVKSNAAYADETVSYDKVRETLEKYPLNSRDMKLMFNTYVADIFAYSQVQTSIIDQFGESSLTDVYALTYENVDWTSDKTALGSWISQTKLLSAVFAGTDLNNGNVYCTQAHKSNGVLVLANLEYYYNSDGDMGVTTINWHSNGRFEYHYCSAGTYEILQAYGTYDVDGNVNLTMFASAHQNGERTSGTFSESDREIINDYIQSEIARINNKIDELQQQNERKQTLDGTEQTEGEHISVCSVNLDFSILSNMIIK